MKIVIVTNLKSCSTHFFLLISTAHTSTLVCVNMHMGEKDLRLPNALGIKALKLGVKLKIA